MRRMRLLWPLRRYSSLFGKMPDRVRIVDVGARDGLQNEKDIIPTRMKVGLIDRLTVAGLSAIEATAFVSPAMVPQMADHKQILSGIVKGEGTKYPVLVPNLRGFTAALESGAKEVAIFASASEAFSKRNINCTIDESFERFAPIMEQARVHNIPVRGYVSCVLGCPYEGSIAPSKVAAVVARLVKLGCYEVSLGDTIGIGTAGTTCAMIEAVAKVCPLSRVAAHFHDTYGQALANILVALEMGVSVVDSSIAGLGGCPYAEGATGNVATEDVVWMLQGLGVETGVDIDKLLAATEYVGTDMNLAVRSRTGRALLARKKREAAREAARQDQLNLRHGGYYSTTLAENVSSAPRILESTGKN